MSNKYLVTLPREFFNNNTVDVARSLLGQILVFNSHKAIITETESYRGSDDAASHAFKGKTNRSTVMFGKSGMSYVYLIYGMYHCLNIVTEGENAAGAVLIRGAKIIDTDILLSGPGKLCRHLQITREHNNIDLINNENFYIAKGHEVNNFKATPRIGISNAKDRLWRFVADNS